MENKALKIYRELSLLKLIREGIEEQDDEGEGKFGLVPSSTDPNFALSQPLNSSHENNTSNGPKVHPLLGKSAQFSGIDPRLTADPSANKEAQEQYPQLRLQQQLKNKQRPRFASTPRLVR